MRRTLKRLSIIIKTFFLTIICILSSCASLNNFYVNDPVPSKEDKAFIGFGTGLTAAPDSTIGLAFAFSEKMIPTYNLNIILRSKAFPLRKVEAKLTRCKKCEGCRNFQKCYKEKSIEEGRPIPKMPEIDRKKSIGEHLNRLSDSVFTSIITLNLPFPGSFGIHGGIMYSVFNKDSKFNLALGGDIGISLAQDSFRLFKLDWRTDAFSTHAVHYDIFAPFSIKLNNKIRFITTPRYSFNHIRLKKFQNNRSDLYTFKPRLRLLSFGLFIDKLYIEYSSTYYKNIYYPNFGAAYSFIF